MKISLIIFVTLRNKVFMSWQWTACTDTVFILGFDCVGRDHKQYHFSLSGPESLQQLARLVIVSTVRLHEYLSRAIKPRDPNSWSSKRIFPQSVLLVQVYYNFHVASLLIDSTRAIEWYPPVEQRMTEMLKPERRVSRVDCLRFWREKISFTWRESKHDSSVV